MSGRRVDGPWRYEGPPDPDVERGVVLENLRARTDRLDRTVRRLDLALWGLAGALLGHVALEVMWL